MDKLIFGISTGFHDSSLAVTQGDKILFASHSERFSKIKNDKTLCPLMVDYAINKFGLPDEIAYYENPFKKKLRQVVSGEKGLTHIFSKHILHNELEPIYKTYDMKFKIKNHSHHLSHAAAGFQTSNFDHATVVVIDAIGEFESATIWKAYYDFNGIARYEKQWSLQYPNSIGLFYSAFTKHVGLKPNEEEYIMMGMASYGMPFHKDLIKDRFVEDMYELKFKENLHTGVNETYLSEKNKMDIASSVQSITEDMIRNIMHRSSELQLSDNLVYCGGVALNCLANKILGEYFSNVWIMPNPGDSGSSLGAAALSYGKKLDWENPYLGYNIDKPYPVTGLLNELEHKGMVGVANGRAEFGPRALGNRSLLADPRGAYIKQQVNTIKQRQQFRPFAPVILEEFVDTYFEMPKNWKTSEYMQVVAPCKYPERFPAIVHYDNTSRVQTVPKNCQSGIRQLLEAWYSETHCPMLLNTSLNIRGEPIVNNSFDAQRFQQLYGVKVL